MGRDVVGEARAEFSPGPTGMLIANELSMSTAEENSLQNDFNVAPLKWASSK